MIDTDSRPYIWIDVAFCVALFCCLLLLQPALIDGDGFDYAGRAIYHGFLAGMVPKHAIVSAMLRPIYLVLSAIGLEQYSLRAFAAIDHLALVGIYLLLARGLYPKFIHSPTIIRLCAIGTVVSYGIISRGATIECYALAVLADVALVTYCLSADLRRLGGAFLAALLLLIAIGIHITNVLLLPMLLVLAWSRVEPNKRWMLFGRVTAVLGVGGMAFLIMMMIGQGARLWPPDVASVFPKGDPEPAQTMASRGARTAYGMVRAIAFLPSLSELSRGVAIGYAASFAAAGALIVCVARRSPLKGVVSGQAALALVALVVPFLALGVEYYPSDPERWLFFLPALWLGIALVWDRYAPGEGALLGKRSAMCALAASVCILLVYNALAGLWPDARGNRYLAGIKEVMALATPNDLVISPSCCSSPLYGYFLRGRTPQYQNTSLMEFAQGNPNDEHAMVRAIEHRIAQQFQKGGRVFAFDVFDEGHHKSEGYPWAHMSNDYGPETFTRVLEHYKPEALVKPTEDVAGIYVLQPAQLSSAKE